MAARYILSTLAFGLSLTGSQAQSTAVPYTDEATGITFSQITEANGMTYGFALPQKGNDFIGRIEAPVAPGWAGFSTSSGMTSGLLVVAWPHGDNVIASLRKADDYASPPVYSGSASLKTISLGTKVNSTAFTYTFLCQNCANIEGLSFGDESETEPIGWAMSNKAVTTPGSPSSATSSHIGAGGQGITALNMAEARSDDFEKWAALASNSTAPPPPTGGGGNSTTPPIFNGTVPVSNTTYDYIVVGGGPSGLITAQRLVETGKSVLLLERGKASYYASGGDLTVPWNDTLTIYEAPYFYNYLASYPGNDAYCDDTPAMAGCILGGGTAINGLAFIRPPSFDFGSKWPVGWRWSDVEASAELHYARNPGTTHPSADGKFYDYGVYDVLSKNLAAAGWNYADSNKSPDDKEKSYGQAAINVLNGRRAGPVGTYLPLMQGKSNFKLLLETMVLRAVRTNSSITGVETQDKAGKRTIYNVSPNGKVILAAGAMSTPRILFRSGIGPKSQIEIVKTGSVPITLPDETAWIDSPVGFVRDHTNLALQFNVTSGMTIMGSDAYLTPSQTDIDLYTQQASGPLTSSSIMRLNSFRTITTSDNTSLIVQTINYATQNNTINTIFVLTHNTTSSGMLGITPEGNTVWTTSPYLHTPTDREAMALAIDEWLAMTRAPNSTIAYNGPANITGAEIVATAKTSAGTHMTGTTIMGVDPKDSVVDADCKVWGTENLFVVDAGMHADLPTGNTQAIVGVAAEHAAKRIIALGTTGGSNSTLPLPSNGTATLPPTTTPVPTKNVSSSSSVSVVPLPTSSSSLLPLPSSSAGLPTSSTAPSTPSPTTTASPADVVKEWDQCGGETYKGATTCAEGLVCKMWNPWYAQCVKA
ncbi:carbohydrate-binding module family 1 protein [Periconia macrospinosa]|uniref:Carbohydrate-binding module family 1 protein n=1 Tax=Periconia macrospinosa TaxID=97972 RepID=A0A2V1DQM7_9PLEO|nr:carbohydrate-binding module family 1 protein [Periconia macrospinosa]